MPCQHVLPCAFCDSFEGVDVEIMESDLFLGSLVSDEGRLSKWFQAVTPTEYTIYCEHWSITFSRSATTPCQIRATNLWTKASAVDSVSIRLLRLAGRSHRSTPGATGEIHAVKGKPSSEEWSSLNSITVLRWLSTLVDVQALGHRGEAVI